MKITVEDLEKHGACQAAIDEFVEDFPAGIDIPEYLPIHQAILLCTRARRWLGTGWHTGLLPMWSLSGADLSRANLSEADLSGANLYRANLHGADLYGADLSGANLSGANLSEASLSGANLYRADLSEASLSGADLSGASLYEASLSGAARNSEDHVILGWKLRNGILVGK